MTGADVVLVLTEWAEFVNASPSAIADLARDRTVIDARNCLDAAAWRAAGWTLHALGRGAPADARALVFAWARALSAPAPTRARAPARRSAR